MAKLPPIVMIHGAFCGGWAFDEFRKPFEAKGYRVSAPTLRHHDCGDEPPPALGSTSLLDYADDLENTIRALPETPILVGHSMGGLLAQMLAARGLARACVLLAPSAPWGVLPSTMFEIASAQTLLLTGDYFAGPIAPNSRIARANALDKLGREERRAIYARFVPESGRATFEVMQWALDMRRASHVRARDVTCPVLCLVGSDDRINPPSTVARIAARYQGRALFEEFDGFSHWLIGEEGWERIAARAIEWLDQVSVESRRTAKSD
jgi:pimeloyl-ACP methyl ester carboxylesterase